MDSPSRVTIWTDGSCTTKGDRRGGYGVYCVYDDTEITVRHGFWNTTTSRMEMMALLEAVSMINPIVSTDVTVYSDSQFVVNAFNEGWLKKWKLICWSGVKNRELWQQIDAAITARPYMKLTMVWLRGHGSNLEDDIVFGNNVADALANYKDQEKWEQDLDLVGYSWFHHEGSDCVFIEKTNKLEEMNSHGDGDIIPLGKCKRATFEELFDVVNGTFLFESFYNGTLTIDYTVKNI